MLGSWEALPYWLNVRLPCSLIKAQETFEKKMVMIVVVSQQKKRKSKKGSPGKMQLRIKIDKLSETPKMKI